MAGNFAGNFRGQTFNALMQPRAVYDRPLTFRGAIAPLGTYQNPDGTEDVGFAWPGIITEPLKALQRLHENSYTEDGRLGMPNPEYQGNKDDALTALLSIYGGNALNPAAAIPKNSVGMFAGRRAGAEAQRGFTAYHGSPHDFDKFDLSKIGSGEGAQAYGHGLYFAENEGVARSYRDDLTGGLMARKPGTLRIDGVDTDLKAVPNNLRNLAYALKYSRGDKEAAMSQLRREAAEWAERERVDPVKYGRTAASWREALIDAEKNIGRMEFAPNRGHMYQVRINASPEGFLDWDLPLSQQSEKVRDTVLSMVPENDRYPNSLRGKDAVLSLQASQPGKFLDRSEVSPMLREAGIPGIKYLDRTSRAAGEGSRNYVVFDDSIIDILKKYGLAGGAIGAGSLFDFNTDQQY